MFESGKLYKIIESRIGCKGIQGSIVKYLWDSTDLYYSGLYNSNDTCIVKVIEAGANAYNKEIWCINKDCIYEEIKEKQFSWRNTLDCKKLFPKDFYSCLDIAKSINYPFICFNGQTYAVNKGNFNDPVGEEIDLK